jgi:ergothioneine biosynthesis protein EgtB
MQPKRTSDVSGTDLAAEYLAVRRATERLCEPLAIEDFIPQPIVDVSPPKWHIAHTTWFFEEMILCRFLANYKKFDPDFGYFFNSYYETLGQRTARNERGFYSRPTVERVLEYRRYVDEAVSRLLEKEVSAEVAALVLLGLNHEQQHQELLITDLKYTFGLNPLFPEYQNNYAPEENTDTKDSHFISVSEGIYEIGYRGDGFCFDNELALHKVYLNGFKISSRLITNAEFIDFIEDAGYRDFRLWHSEGWDWVNREQITAPLYWHFRDGEWFQFTLGGLRPVLPDSPVCHVSFFEAAAFAEWRGCRLPTEFEWEAAAGKFDWGLRWEWTNSAYLPYPGFKKPLGAVGEYNGKFMINQMVLRGASVATPPGHSRPTYRNFFHPHLRWQFTGIRLAL